MKIISKSSVICILFFTYANITYSQSGEWTVITSSRDTLRSCIIREVSGNSVFLICGISFRQIALDSLNILIKPKDSPFMKGARLGALAGLIVGSIGGLASYPENPGKWAKHFGKAGYAAGGGVEGAAVGFLLGGIVGAIVGGDDDIYDLSLKSKEEKIEFLRNLIDEN